MRAKDDPPHFPTPLQHPGVTLYLLPVLCIRSYTPYHQQAAIPSTMEGFIPKELFEPGGSHFFLRFVMLTRRVFFSRRRVWAVASREREGGPRQQNYGKYRKQNGVQFYCGTIGNYLWSRVRDVTRSREVRRCASWLICGEACVCVFDLCGCFAAILSKNIILA